jgi:hypothetical protein
MSVPVFGFDGQATTQVFSMVGINPLKPTVELDIPVSRTRDCCNAFSIKALADTVSTDDFKNDRSGFLWWFNSFVTTAPLILQKYNNTTNAFEDLIALTDNTYGTFYAYGFFVNSSAEKFVGYQLKWRNVLSIHGAGGYRVKCTPTSVTGTNDLYSPNYCLKQYTSERADVTARIEYYLNNITGISSDDYSVKDFGNLNWYNAFRLSGYFGFPKSTYESDYVEYNNGQRQWVEDEQEVEYTLRLKQTPAFVHEIIRTDVMQADRIYITDYNSKNPLSFIQKQVIKNGEYAPDWKRLQSKLATVEVSFKQEFNNLKKLRC